MCKARLIPRILLNFAIEQEPLRNGQVSAVIGDRHNDIIIHLHFLFRVVTGLRVSASRQPLFVPITAVTIDFPRHFRLARSGGFADHDINWDGWQRQETVPDAKLMVTSTTWRLSRTSDTECDCRPCQSFACPRILHCHILSRLVAARSFPAICFSDCPISWYEVITEVLFRYPHV